MPYATGVRGARIYYETRGTAGPPAVLIQGLGLSSRFWFDVPEKLAAGPDPWRTITPDHRGVGKSDRPFGPYLMRTMADDVAAVLDHARLERAYVVGISLGGMVAQHVAIRHPSRVAGLVLLATTAGFPHVRPPSLLSLARFLSLPISGHFERNEVAPVFARLLLSRKDAPRANELLADWPKALQSERTSLRVYAAHFAAILGHSTGSRLRKIKCPTVIVTGDDDSLLPHHNSRLLAKLVPGAHLEIVQGGHIIPASDPECVRRALDRARAMAGEEPAARAADPAELPVQMLKVPVRSK